jgi:hypothetical protein
VLTAELSPHDADAAALVALHAELVALHKTSANAQRWTGDMVQASLDLGRRHDEASETFRRTYYPRAGKVVAVFGEVYVLSPKGRRSQLVYSAPEVSAS